MKLPYIMIRGLLGATLLLAGMSPALWAQDASDAPTEPSLVEVLKSDAADADKAIACKQLAIHGSAAAVPHLAPLLSRPELSSWARIALEAIPGPEADAALRDAAEALDGLLLVGTLNSIGVRRDAHAIDLLTQQLASSDDEVASAAAVALGRIGNDAAAEKLVTALSADSAKTRSAAAEGCVLCAEEQLRQGNPAAAEKLYQTVRAADVGLPRVLEATRGVLIARGEQSSELLRELLRSPELPFFRLALTTARELPGSAIDEALAAELEHASPERAVGIVWAMADRPETVDVGAMVKVATSAAPEARLAAVQALAQIGDESCFVPLLNVAQESDPELAGAARDTLATLSGAGIDDQVAAEAVKAQGARQALLFELIGKRRIRAIAPLLAGVQDKDPAIRHSALAALGEVAELDHLPQLIQYGVAADRTEDTDVAKRALLAASVRMADPNACAARIAAELPKSKSTAVKATLLEVLGAVGGQQALLTLAEAARGEDDQLQDVSTRLLGQWMTADAAPVLLDLTRTAPGDKYQTRALRGYLRIARQFVLPDEIRLQMCREALQAAKSPADKLLVLEVLGRYPTMEGMQMAAALTADQEIVADARATTLLILHHVGSEQVDVNALLKTIGLDKVELEIVSARYGAGTQQKDVTKLIAEHAGSMPLIVLPGKSYNKSFGDPAPNEQKSLTIAYRMNGQAGEATFAENDVIMLPMPK